jgi:hypothetical protein
MLRAAAAALGKGERPTVHSDYAEKNAKPNSA